MKQTTFHLGFFLTPLIPVIIYLRTAGAMYDTYSISIIFGVYAFILVCNQFYLASQPVWLTKLLGAKTVRALHGSSPLLIVLLSFVHALLKLSNGFSLSSTQAILGLVAFILFFVGTMAALLFLCQYASDKKGTFCVVPNKT